MPEFLGRPNVPNALANSLVQLAATQENPLGDIFKQIGAGADKYAEKTAHDQDMQKKFEQEKQLKQMEIDARGAEHRAGLLTELVKNDKVVESLIKSKPMSATDAASLLPSGVTTTSNLVKGDFGSRTPPSQGIPNPAAEGGIPSEQLGLPSGFTVNPKPSRARGDANRYITVDSTMSSQFPALKGIEGKDISTAQWMMLNRAHEAADRYKGAMDDKLWARAKQLASEDMGYIQASMDGDEAKVKEIIERKKRLVLATGGRVGSAASAPPKKDLGSIIADAFEKGISQ